MKTILATIATVFVTLVALPQKAEARPHPVGHSYIYQSGYSSCGKATFIKRVIVSYNRCGQPIYRYYRMPSSYRCGTVRHYTNKPSRHSARYHRGSHHSRHRGVTISGRHGSIRIFR